MSIFLFLETILFPLSNLLLTDDNSFDFDCGWRSHFQSANLSEHTVPIKIQLQHGCIAAQFIFNRNASVTGHEHVTILRPLLPLQPRS